MEATQWTDEEMWRMEKCGVLQSSSKCQLACMSLYLSMCSAFCLACPLRT